ncbi:MAG TPA: PEP-CTERM sorting domain-containing protein [Rubrivivax sp.]|nr:PEP-CTERM sorting domain-containing protein [Rubrivivax sp.]
MKQVATLAVGAAVVNGPAHAALTSYNSLAGFQGAIQNAGLDDFNSLQASNGSVTSPQSRTAGTYSYEASSSGGLYSVGPSNADRWLSVLAVTDTLTFSTFPAGVGAIGGYFGATDFDGFFATGDVTVVVDDDLGSTQSFTHSPANGLLFIGFVSTGNIVSLSITAANPPGTDSRFATANDLFLAQACIPGQTCRDVQPVSEPASIALAGLALLGMAATRRRLKRVA